MTESNLITNRIEDAEREDVDESASYEPEDHSDDICPCGDPDCNRPFGHPEEG